ncbi:MAG: hypothetical protein ACI861_001553, partial [Paracoccaceae bacterium]
GFPMEFPRSIANVRQIAKIKWVKPWIGTQALLK